MVCVNKSLKFLSYSYSESCKKAKTGEILPLESVQCSRITAITFFGFTMTFIVALSDMQQVKILSFLLG